MLEFLADWLATLEDAAGNTAKQWILALAVFVLTIAALFVIKRVVLRRLRVLAARTSSKLDDIVATTLERTHSLFYLALGVYAGMQFLRLPAHVAHVLGQVVLVVTLLQVGLWANAAVSAIIKVWREQSTNTPSSSTLAGALGFVARIVIWSMIVLLVLSNLGVEVGALIAGLGIGGIATALAVQNVLGELFASLSIYFDRPFDLGDFVVVGDMSGTIEKVGLRSSRLRSLSGEQLVFSNADLARSRIKNYRRMEERRILFRLGVTYGTPAAKLKSIPRMVKEAIEAQDETRFDRAHFSSYGDFALVIEVVYYVLSPDYARYMDIQQSVNFALYERFEQAGIEFAFPTQTLHVHREDPAEPPRPLRAGGAATR